MIEQRLFDIIERDPQEFIRKWVDNKSRESEFIIETAISKNIIRRNKNIYKYGSDIIGNSLEDVISFLDDKKNQDIKGAILAAIEVK